MEKKLPKINHTSAISCDLMDTLITEKENSDSVLKINDSKKLNNYSRNVMSELTLMKKMENPYWVPRSNEDLFRVKKIFKEMKESKKKSSFLDTNRAFQTKNGQKFKSEIFNSFDKSSKNFVQKNKENIFLTYNKVEDIGRSKTRLDNKIDLLKGEKYKGSRNFIEKTRELVLLKYTTKVKNERFLRVEETFRNEIESIKDTVHSMKLAKNSFEDNFLEKFDLYIKHLAVQKEKERVDLFKKEEEKSNLEREIRQLENRKNRQKEKIDYYNEINYFLICIKEKREYESSQFRQIAQKSNMKTSKTINSFVTQKQDKLQKKRFSILGINNDTQPNDVRYPKEIYKDQSELIRDLKKIEDENIDKLELYNKISREFNENTRELMKIENDDDLVCENLKGVIESKEKYLDELKLKRERNIEQKLKLSQKNKSDLKNHKTNHRKNHSKNKIFNSLEKIGNNIILKLSESKLDNKGKFLINIVPIRSIINIHDFCLEYAKFMERIFDWLCVKYNFYLQNNQKEMKDFEKELDNTRKSKIADDAVEEVRKKRENLNKIITAKYNKVFHLPRRKVYSKFKPVKKEHIKHELERKYSDLNFHSLVDWNEGNEENEYS